jgi:hypothetical protein
MDQGSEEVRILSTCGEDDRPTKRPQGKNDRNQRRKVGIEANRPDLAQNSLELSK